MLRAFKYGLLSFILTGWFTPVMAQEFIWSVGNYSFFDNREYFNPFVDGQTIFGSRIFGSAGLAINDNNRFAFGADYLYEFGSKGEGRDPDIILYYQGRYRDLDFRIGAFPRYEGMALPLALFSDTIHYYRPNIEGMMLDYQGSAFRHNAWIDWTGRQTLTRKEAFMLGFSGVFSRGIIMYQHHFIMSHIAHSKDHDPDEHIRDNGAYNVMAGLNLSSYTVLDTLTFTSGVLGSYDRVRSVYDMTWPVGWITEADIGYRGFGLHGLYYRGEEQVIVSGDGFYRSDMYGRADLYYGRQSTYINGMLQFSMHFVPGITDLSMALVIRVQLDGALPLHLRK